MTVVDAPGGSTTIASMRAAWPSRRQRRCRGAEQKAVLLAAAWCCFVSLAGAAAARKGARDKRPVVLESIFVQGTDGWTLQGPQMEQAAHNVQGPEAQESDMAIEAADHSSNVWYFTSPLRFSGDRTAAYNGELSFGLYHKQRPPPTNSHPLKTRAGLEGADVILEAQCGHALHISGVFDRPRSVPTQYSIALEEDAGWIDSRTGNAPRRLDMLGVLANLNAIKIRGAFYLDPERVSLQDVRLSGAARGAVSGLDLFPCCSSVHAGEMDVCSKRDTDLTPQGVRFDCKGSFKQLITIKSIYPRFARRSGGVFVTVTGENFGLTGSNTILRVNGKHARNCRYPITSFFQGHAPVMPSLLAEHCTNRKWDFGEDGLDCGGLDCPLCKPPLVPGHCTNGIFDKSLGETSQGIISDKYGQKHDCGGPCLLPDTCCNQIWEETEAGIDCGGADCWPCDPPPILAGTAVQRSILTQGKMAQSGCFCYVDIANLTIPCPPDNATATQRAAIANVPLINIPFATEDDRTGHLIGHDYDDRIGQPVNVTDCINVAFLSLSDPETDAANYVGRYLVLTGGLGAGQHSKILAYEPANKRVSLGVWHKNEEQRNVSINTQKQKYDEYNVGFVKVINGGSGYSDGTWRIPGLLFHNSTTKAGAINPVDAWGTFKTDKATGRIISVEIVEKGRFESPYYRRILKKVEYVSADDIICSRSCQGSDAVIFIDFFTNIIMSPTVDSTYMIIDEEQLKPTAGHLHRVPSIPNHNTLICEVDEGDGKDLPVDVQSLDNMGTPSSSCYTEFSRGFEYGAHDYVWSLQAGIRQSVAVKEVIVSAIDIDKRTNDIYIAGKILGSCTEGPRGCFGVVGSHLPDRGLSQQGDYNPLYLDPHGTTSTFVMKLNQYAKPLWTTMIDSQSQFGRIQPWSLVVDSSRSPAHVYVGGTYLTPTSTVVRFWHADPITKRPTRIDRNEVNDKHGGCCNRAECVEGVCTNNLPANDEFTCADRKGGFMDHQSCRIARCAYIEGFEARDETQDDAWIAEISQQGRWLWTKTRLSISRRGFLLNLNDFKLASTSSADNAHLSGTSAVYLALTYSLPPHSWPDLNVLLGNVAHEFWGIDVDEEDLDVLTVPLPTTETRTRFSVIAKFSKGGAIWARRIGPLGADGGVVSLKTDGTDLYVAGNYMVNASLKDQLTFDTCSFGHPRHTLKEGAPASQGAWEHSADGAGVLASFTNSLCFPFANMHARYTMASWERTRAQQWDDISGNEMHARVSRGTVTMDWREPSYGAASTQVYLKGQKGDGMKFPENSIPQNFTICSVSRMPVMSQGSILDSTDLSNWAHGHYGGHPGQAWYGTVNFQTKTGIQKNGENIIDGHTMKIDDWIVMCGQNRKSGSVFLANGVDTSLGSSGGYGGGQLSINHGRVGLLRGFSQWEMIEVAIWNHWLSVYDIRSVMMYYEDLLRGGEKLLPQKAVFTEGKNLFLASYGVNGQLRWHREAIGGDLTTTCMTLSRANLTRGGLDKTTHVKGPSDRDEASTHWVYVGGRVCSETTAADFGVTKYPMACSASKNLGEYLSLQQKEKNGSKGTGNSHRGLPCNGQIVARGSLCDVYLAKYSADTGELAWLKRLGQRDSFESPVDIVTDDYNNEVIMVGNYYNYFGFELYRDVFDLVAAGRPSAVGCAVDRKDNQIKARLGRTLTDNQVGYPNCSLVGVSQIGEQVSAFILSVDARNTIHGQSSRPDSPCNATEELGCNADGLLWARTLGSGIKEASTRTTTRALGVTKTHFRNQILSWASFQGFITATQTRGIKTQGVDDEGFFNCCLKLKIPMEFTELQDVTETFIFAMES